MPVFHTQLSSSSPAFLANAEHMKALVQDVSDKATALERGGPDDLRERHASRGRLLPRQRLAQLLDPGSPFLEIGQFAAWDIHDDPVSAAGLVTGIGRIAGREAMILIDDATVSGGALCALTIKKHLRAQEIARENNLPCIHLLDSAGSPPCPDDYSYERGDADQILFNQAKLRAAGISQIACVMGPCSGAGAYIAAMADECVIVRDQGAIFVTDRTVVKATTGEIADAEELGGATHHARTSGIADHIAENDDHALAIVRRIAETLPRIVKHWQSRRKSAPPLYPAAQLAGIVSADPDQAVDVREIIIRIVDGSELDEFKAGYGETLVTGFVHIHGIPAGVVANNGTMSPEAMSKGAQFIELCSRRNIPLVFLQNTTGIAMGRQAENAGIAKFGAGLMTAVATARVPKITMIIGGSFGTGNHGMCGRGFSPRFLWLWPNARIATMDGGQMADVLFLVRREEIERKGPGWSSDEEKAFRAPIIEKFERKSHALHSSARLWDDGIIDPVRSREVLALSLSAAMNASPV